MTVDISRESLMGQVLYLFVIWIIQLIIIKLGKKHLVKREELLKISLLISLVVYFVFLSIYFGLIINYNGIHQFRWTEPKFYLGILPLIITYIAIITVYIITSVRFNKPLKRR